MILHEKDSAVNGKSNKKVYFLRTAVVTSLYAGGACSSLSTYSLDEATRSQFTSLNGLAWHARWGKTKGVPHGCAHSSVIDVSRHTTLIESYNLFDGHTRQLLTTRRVRFKKEEKESGLTASTSHFFT